jgi:hypothetical protein
MITTTLTRCILHIADRADVLFQLIRLAADRLCAHDLLHEATPAAFIHEGVS